MALEQLYYTSCEQGLTGFAGYQFNAVSPGASAETQREVLSQIAYKPPRSQMFPAEADELARCPVNLCFRPGTLTLLANVEYVGQDFSKRFGNYFAHAFAADSVDDLTEALGPLLPIELWRAPVWAASQADGTELPRFSGQLPRGLVSPASVRDFLAGHLLGDRLDSALSALLSAAAAAVEGRARPVLLVESDSDRAAQWIAAVSYLLPPRAGAALAFATYRADPSASRLHLIGTVPETLAELPLDVIDSFVVFDLTAGSIAEVAVHPLAELAVRVGVSKARALWQTAGTLAAPGSSSLDAWFGPVAAAAALGRVELTVAEADRAVTWATDAALDPAALAELAMVLHDQPARRDHHLPALVELARRGGDQALCDEIRFEQIDSELARVRAADTEDTRDSKDTKNSKNSAAIRIESPTIRRRTAGRLRELLDVSTPVEALRLLHWARRAGLEPELDQVFLFGFGQRALVSAAAGGKQAAAPGILHAALRDWPAIRRGFVAELATLAGKQPEEADQLLDGPIGEFLAGADFDSDLREYPALQESVLIARARRQPAFRPEVLLRILARRGQELPDAKLLKRLWQGWLWSREDLLAIAAKVPVRRIDDDEVLIWFVTPVERASENTDIEWYVQISSDLLASPAGKRLKKSLAAMEEVHRFIAVCESVQNLAGLSKVVAGISSNNRMIALIARRFLLHYLMRSEWEPKQVCLVLERIPPNIVNDFLARLKTAGGNWSAADLKRIAGVYLRFASMYENRARAEMLAPLTDIVRGLKKAEWDELRRLVELSDPLLADEFHSFETRYRKLRFGGSFRRGG
ncbi:GTPase-associated protein 1-related protein [Catenulispora rubra]|uniref:GTPase-associated protein 1-related protein n=1 Tax=Catenulispora rubra TaxID=280293 RepID=UPI0018924374|nr:GTPase-associated protein 1-related protein [Catenulispora rubra]